MTLSTLQSIDLDLLFRLNSFDDQVFESMMIFFSSPTALTVIASLLTLKMWLGRKQRKEILFVVGAIITSDAVSTYLLKNNIPRERPCHAIETVRQPAGCGGILSFPSNHSANTAAYATALSLFYRTPLVIGSLWLLALLVATSRVYLAAHYPSDVLCGLILGCLITLALHAYYRRFDKKNPKAHATVS